jgi:hypothetical protein
MRNLNIEMAGAGQEQPAALTLVNLKPDSGWTESVAR